MYKVSISAKKDSFIYFFPESIIFFVKYVALLLSVVKVRKRLKQIEVGDDKSLTILGNGPSLKNLDFSRYNEREIDFLTVNNFPNSETFFSVKPEYVVFIDTMFWIPYEKLESHMSKSVGGTFESLNKSTWRVTLFVPAVSEKVIKERIHNDNIKLVLLPDVGYEFENAFLANLSLKVGIPPPRLNVVVTSIYIASLLNYRSIEVFGMDMDRFVDIGVDQTTNDAYLGHRYFNVEKKVKSKNKVIGKHPNNMYIRLLREAKTFRWFGIMSNYALENNIKIVNKSSFSMLDMFKRGG